MTADEAILDRARALAPEIRAAADEIEATRRVPDALDERMGSAGLFGLYLPAAYGGVEADPLTATLAVEEIARVDGSVGWISMIGSVLSRRFAWMDPDEVLQMRDEVGSLRAAGSNRPLGRAIPTDGGWIATGRWDFQSGIEHAAWMFGTCVLMDGDEVRRNAQGEPVTRAMAVPVTAGKVIDTWNVVGLRGTGSFDFEIDGLYVPTARTVSRAEPPVIESPLYHPRFFSVWSHTVHAGCSLGIARGALDELSELAGARGSTSSTALLRDRPFVQRKVGEAEAIVRSARAYLISAIEGAWEAASKTGYDPLGEIADLRLAITHAGHEAVRAVDLAFEAAGTNAAFVDNRLERYFRDMHIAVQHGATAPRNYEIAGRIFLKLDAGVSGW